ncbi:MAG: endonuclease III [bacterium]|jgi:endonuclease-3
MKPKLETREEKKKRAASVVRAMRKRYPDATTALRFSSPFELLVATVLAAQCTDKKVNEVTPVLFKKYKGPAEFARARRPSLEKIIKPTGFFRNKSRNLIALSRDIMEKHGGEVPDNMDELVALRGVGRKTANVVLAGAYDTPGIIVDTHMIRIANRLGFTNKKDPVKIEQDLMNLLSRRVWSDFSFMTVLHGREVCKARKPLCHVCNLERWCPSSELKS